MEETILEIINEHYNPYEGEYGRCHHEFAAKEIAKLFIKFIEWGTSKNSPAAVLYGNQSERFATTKKDYTIEELFNYWLKKDNSSQE
jgi:hypothetical protein